MRTRTGTLLIALALAGYTSCGPAARQAVTGGSRAGAGAAGRSAARSSLRNMRIDELVPNMPAPPRIHVPSLRVPSVSPGMSAAAMRGHAMRGHAFSGLPSSTPTPAPAPSPQPLMLPIRQVERPVTRTAAGRHESVLRGTAEELAGEAISVEDIGFTDVLGRALPDQGLENSAESRRLRVEAFVLMQLAFAKLGEVALANMPRDELRSTVGEALAAEAAKNERWEFDPATGVLTGEGERGDGVRFLGRVDAYALVSKTYGTEKR